MKISSLIRPAALSAAVLLSLSLAACGQEKPADKAEQPAEKSSTTETKAADTSNAGELTIHTATGEQKIPANPNPLAVYDMTALQNLTALGVATQGFPDIADERVSTLNLKVKDAPATTQIGTLFEPNLEVLHGLKPQAVFVGARMAKHADEIAKVAPTYNLTIDTKDAYAASKQQITDFAEIFNKKAEGEKLIADINKAIADTKAAVQGKGNGLVILVSGNKLSAYGKASRFGYLHTTFGVPMADETIADDNPHGQAVGFEYIQKIDPDWLFVLDQSAAIGREGPAAEQVLDNPLIHNTKAWKNKQIVYISPDSYMAFGGYYQWIKDAKIITDAFSAKK